MIKKALRFSLKVEGVLRLCEMSEKHWSYSILEHRKKLIKIPYKPCAFLIILEPKTQNGLQNDQKSITFFTLNHMAFRRVEKPYKTCRILIILEPRTQNGLQSDKKSIRFFTINHMALHHVEKPYKTCRKLVFLDVQFGQFGPRSLSIP